MNEPATLSEPVIFRFAIGLFGEARLEVSRDNGRTWLATNIQVFDEACTDGAAVLD